MCCKLPSVATGPGMPRRLRDQATISGSIRVDQAFLWFMLKLAKLEPNDKISVNRYTRIYIDSPSLFLCLVFVGNLRDQHTTLMYRSWALIAFSVHENRKNWLLFLQLLLALCPATCSSIDCHASLPMVMMIMYPRQSLKRGILLGASLLINFERPSYAAYQVQITKGVACFPLSHSLPLGVSDAPLYTYALKLYVLYSMTRNSSALSN